MDRFVNTLLGFLVVFNLLSTYHYVEEGVWWLAGFSFAIAVYVAWTLRKIIRIQRETREIKRKIAELRRGESYISEQVRRILDK